jgi:3-oxoacyl-[acyl-carrier protein] reductase
LAEPRAAVVTGAAGGIGAAVVVRLRARGMPVAALDSSADRLAALRAKLADSDGPPLRTYAVDVGDAAALLAVAEQVASAFGNPAALVTSAGIFARTPAFGGRAGRAEEILRTNLSGVLHATAAFGPLLARGGGGRIVHVASIAAVTGAALGAAYAASKAGVVAVTRSHARELAADGIAVNAVLPGYVDTAMAAPERAALMRFVVPRVPLKRLAEPDEIAEVVAFLATCSTPYLTGAALIVDGGQTCG